MGQHRDRPLDAATAERLLAGGGGEPAELARLLAAACGPARPSELAGEQAAMLAFRSAQAAGLPGPVQAHRRWMSARWRQLMPIKVAAVAGALAAGGMALAAGTVALPQLHGSPTVDNTGWPGVTDGRPGTGAPTGLSSTNPNAGSTPASPSLDGLCVAHLAEAAVDPERARDNPAFAALAAAAGGPDKVTDFCRNRQSAATPSADPDPGSSPAPSPTPSVNPPATKPNPGRSAEPQTHRPSTPAAAEPVDDSAR
ncbi:MAG TPA: hypothetical protein VF163_17970 [Micromonosporaceae bacterium]